MIIIVMKNNYCQASPGLNMIIKVIKIKDYQVSLRLDMLIINVRKIMIIKRVQDST